MGRGIYDFIVQRCVQRWLLPDTCYSWWGPNCQVNTNSAQLDTCHFWSEIFERFLNVSFSLVLGLSGRIRRFFPASDQSYTGRGGGVSSRTRNHRARRVTKPFTLRMRGVDHTGQLFGQIERWPDQVLTRLYFQCQKEVSFTATFRQELRDHRPLHKRDTKSPEIR